MSTITDRYQGKVNRYIDKKTLQELSALKQWRGLWQIIFDWSVVFAAIYLCEKAWALPLYASLPIYLFTIFIIGTRQASMAVMMHEGVHYRLFKNRTLNDWISEIFLAWPVLITMNGYRQNHFAHHAKSNTPDDPDWARKQNVERFKYPKKLSEMLKITFNYLIGAYFFVIHKELNVKFKIPNVIKYSRMAFYVAVIAASIYFSFWQGLLMYWVVPVMTYFVWVLYVRGISEHFGGIEHETELLKQTRHIDTNFLGHLMVAPNNINYHIAHHLYPSIPFYNLPKAQELLMENESYRNEACITKGYIGLIKECMVKS